MKKNNLPDDLEDIATLHKVDLDLMERKMKEKEERKAAEKLKRKKKKEKKKHYEDMRKNLTLTSSEKTKSAPKPEKKVTKEEQAKHEILMTKRDTLSNDDTLRQRYYEHINQFTIPERETFDKNIVKHGHGEELLNYLLDLDDKEVVVSVFKYITRNRQKYEFEDICRLGKKVLTRYSDTETVVAKTYGSEKMKEFEEYINS